MVMSKFKQSFKTSCHRKRSNQVNQNQKLRRKWLNTNEDANWWGISPNQRFAVLNNQQNFNDRNDYINVTDCRYPSIKPGLKGNQSCYTSACNLSQSINNVCLPINTIYLCLFMSIYVHFLIIPYSKSSTNKVPHSKFLTWKLLRHFA